MYVCMYIEEFTVVGKIVEGEEEEDSKGGGGNCTIACVNYIAYVTDFHGNVLYQDSFIYLLHS